jgi:hypothetical protein
MLIPSAVRVLGRNYSIVVKEELTGLAGQCDYDNLRIDIRSGQHSLLEADTLLHELVHAIDDAMQLKMSERQVHCTANGVIALLKDNPEFLEYLYKAVKE